ncbi:hypothetical protein NL676_011583 [Syzygium grande]|nr:hypothetical protein NL676_011583 [Syzygium grande]
MKRISSSYLKAERTVLRLLHGRETRTRLTQIHAYFLRHGLHQSNQVLAHFVSVCGSLNRMPHAARVFDQTHYPNVILFNAVIKGHSLCGPFERCLDLFSAMKGRGIWPDEYTFAPLLKSCSSLGDLRLGRGMHRDVLVAGFVRFASIQIGLVELYAGCAEMGDAQKVFDEMLHREVIVWNLMVRGFCRAGDVEMGLGVFRRMSERNVASWNTIISCLGQSGRDREALELFDEMRKQGFEPDEVTVVSLLPLCARLGAVDAGQQIESYAGSSRLLKDFISVGNAVIDFYCKSGDMEASMRKFRDLPRKNVVSFNTMITGMAFNGKDRLGVELFEEMATEGVIPNDATFVGVLTCCSHAGMVDRARELFASMSMDHQIEPKLEHYGCMVDLLGRSGCVREAFDLIRKMPMKPNAALWGSVLSACRTHGDMELAELTVKELIDLEPWNSGNYVLLSNLYAEAGRWNEVEKVRVQMRGRCVHKVPGYSAVG